MTNISIEFDEAKKVIDKINEANTSISDSIIFAKNAASSIPNEIKGSIISKFNGLSSKLANIKSECEKIYNSTSSSVNNYWVLENGEFSEETEKVISELTSETGSLGRMNSAFFKNLSDKGIGTLQKTEHGNDIYTISDKGYTYSYIISTGKLKIRDNNTSKETSIIVGLYFPENSKDLSKLNTTTLLPGDGEHSDSHKYEVEGIKQINEILDRGSSSVVIIPQAKESDNIGGYVYASNEVTHCTKFTNLITNQAEGAKNNIVGLSSGGFSGLKIAATDGQDTYDGVYVYNSYMKTNSVCNGVDYSTLKDKEIFFFISENGVKNPNTGQMDTGKIQENIQYMHNNGFDNVTVASSDANLVNYVSNINNQNISVVGLDNKKYYGHTAMWKGVRDTEVFSSPSQLGKKIASK